MCLNLGNPTCGSIYAQALIGAQRTLMCFLLLAVVAVLVLILLAMISVGIGLGYHYCIVENNIQYLVLNKFMDTTMKPKESYDDEVEEAESEASPESGPIYQGWSEKPSRPDFPGYGPEHQARSDRPARPDRPESGPIYQGWSEKPEVPSWPHEDDPYHNPKPSIPEKPPPPTQGTQAGYDWTTRKPWVCTYLDYRYSTRRTRRRRPEFMERKWPEKQRTTMYVYGNPGKNIILWYGKNVFWEHNSMVYKKLRRGALNKYFTAPYGVVGLRRIIRSKPVPKISPRNRVKYWGIGTATAKTSKHRHARTIFSRIFGISNSISRKRSIKH